ncbi:carbohydrate ABC transporter permease [Tessaracoccus oleiagri]|uniref:Multiple sugar transport system permease protein n=1 Tax=Tessaracoccus oleiagri TaxID=686624 RepID=A0A1G9HIK5_9ACTN|nr:carbohydrate ABC transporter permease [Tessaracoccus oleiagri]SDL12742.1 multiple sugar transport system permease protein [Tessaracoccus oleiagri]
MTTTTKEAVQPAVVDSVPEERRRRRRSTGEDALFRPRGVFKVIIQILLAIATVITLFPFYAMVIMSFKAPTAMTFPDSLFPTDLTISAYAYVLQSDEMLRWALNTLIYSVVSVVLVLLLSSMAAYAFAKKRFPGRTPMFWMIIAMLMVPYHITLIPLFVMIAGADGVNTYWGLIAPSLANAQAIFLLRQFIIALPDELLEAAKLDGASEIRIFFQVVLPLCKPILATLGLFVFLWHWNDFLWPLIIAQTPEMRVLTTGVSSLMRESQPLNIQLASAALAILPIFIAYLFAQRYFTQGVTMSGMKG